MQIEQIDRDAAEWMFSTVLGDVSSYAEWGYPSYREEALRDMSEAFARHRLASLSARPAVGEDVVERGIAVLKDAENDLYWAFERGTAYDRRALVLKIIAAMGGENHG